MVLVIVAWLKLTPGAKILTCIVMIALSLGAILAMVHEPTLPVSCVTVGVALTHCKVLGEESKTTTLRAVSGPAFFITNLKDTLSPVFAWGAEVRVLLMESDTLFAGQNCVGQRVSFSKTLAELTGVSV